MIEFDGLLFLFVSKRAKDYADHLRCHNFRFSRFFFAFFCIGSCFVFFLWWFFVVDRLGWVVVAFARSSLGESIPSMTSSQDSLLAPSAALYSRPSGSLYGADATPTSGAATPTSAAAAAHAHRSAEQQKKKGLKSSLGKFFGGKKDKVGFFFFCSFVFFFA